MASAFGRFVHYKLSVNDAAAVNGRRSDYIVGGGTREPTGFQAHVGNGVLPGDTFPALAVRAFGPDPGSAVNLQVFLDGNDTYWATSRMEGPEMGQWSWPVRD